MHPTTPSFFIEKPEGPLYIVTDCHLDFDQAPFEEFIEMLERLPQAQVLICLGDLFKVWLAMPKFWTDAHRRVMDAFRMHRERGSKVVFVAGNRKGEKDNFVQKQFNQYFIKVEVKDESR